MMESMEVYVLLEGKKNPMLISLDKNEKVSDFIKKIVQTYPASLGKIDQDEILLQFENVDFSKPKTQVKTLDLSKNNENNPIIIKAPPQQLTSQQVQQQDFMQFLELQCHSSPQAHFLKNLDNLNICSFELFQKDLAMILQDIHLSNLDIEPLKEIFSQGSISDKGSYSLNRLIFQGLSKIDFPLQSLSIFQWHQLIYWEDIENKKFNNLVNSYLLEKIIHQNTQEMTQLFRAQKNNEVFVIKICQDPKSEELNNLRLLGSHPHIIKLHDSLELTYLHVMIFPFIEFNGEEMPRDSTFIRIYFKQLIQALDFCHFKQFIHLDVKPSNVLLDLEYNKLYLSDFGFSVSFEDATLFPSMTLRGTWKYSAPEVLNGTGAYIEADIWSAGVTLAYWIYGCNIFSGNSYDEVWSCLQNFDFSDLPSAVVQDSRDLQDIVQSILVIETKKRPSTKQILQLLE